MRVTTALAGIAAMFVLAGCGGAGDSGRPATELATTQDPRPAASAAPVETEAAPALAEVDRDAVLAGGYVAHFRERLPSLAADRGDKPIANDGARACRYLTEFAQYPGDRDVILRRFGAALDNGNGARLEVSDACPDRAALLSRIARTP